MGPRMEKGDAPGGPKDPHFRFLIYCSRTFVPLAVQVLGVTRRLFCLVFFFFFSFWYVELACGSLLDRGKNDLDNPTPLSLALIAQLCARRLDELELDSSPGQGVCFEHYWM